MNSKEVLINYLTESLSWERGRQAKIKMPEYKNNVDDFRVEAGNEDRRLLSIILKKCLTERAFKKIGENSLVTITVGNPPKYDLSITEERNLKDGMVDYLCISNNGALLGSVLKFSMLRKGEEWRIDNIQQKHGALSEDAWKNKSSI